MEPDIEQDVAEEAPQVSPEQFIASVVQSQNLVPDMEEGELSTIARQVIDDYDMDKASMSEWLESMEKAIDLAKLVKKEKNYPFKNASNIKYPLVTSAALQFNARAYPAIVPAQGACKVQVHGSDPQGTKAARAERVGAFTSWQLASEIEEWEEETDSLLVQLPIVGDMVRKVWHDPVDNRPRCRLLDAGSFIINAKAKTIADTPRCTEEIPKYPSEIETKIRSGDWMAFEYSPDPEDDDGPQEFLEQHLRLDLDEDGYSEPYIVTVHKDTETVVRLVADFSEEDVRYTREMQTQMVTQQVPMQMYDDMGQPNIVMTQQEVPQQVEVVTGITAIRRGSYFVHYKFMPSLDGTFHGTGLGILLGDISGAIDTIINQLLDAGHMASLGGGWIGSGFRMKGGSQRFSPGEWKLAGETGSAIRDNIVPMTFPGPDAVLFQMLGMLIEAGREISSTKDIMTGDSGGRVQTATTTLALIEQGMMVFSAAYKRIFRSLKQEYKLLAKINATTLDPQKYNAFHDDVDEEGRPVEHDPAQDFGAADMDIQPVADPNSVTKMQEMAKAQLLKEMAAEGLIAPQPAAKRILEAAQISDVDDLTPEPDPAEIEMQNTQRDLSLQMMNADAAQKFADIEKTRAEVQKITTEAMKNMTEADAEAARVRLEEIQTILKAQSDELERTLKRGLAGLEAESRDRSDARRAFVDAAKAASAGGSRVLGGQPMAGS